MAKSVDLKLLIKHLSNGTLGENMCIICLQPLKESFENIFTKICKQEDEFCVADVLEIITKIKFTEADNYNVCIDCYKMALMAYQFYILSSRTNLILNYYCDELTQNSDNVDLPEGMESNALFISLPTFVTATNINYNLNAIGNHVIMEDISKIKTKRIKFNKKQDDDNVIMFVQENKEKLFYKIEQDGSLVLLEDIEKIKYKKSLSDTNFLRTPRKCKKKLTKSCDRCPMKYPSYKQLKEHMKLEHNLLDVFICKVCKAIIEDEFEYYNHLLTHTNVYQCAVCHTVFKTRDTIIEHLKWHENEKTKNRTEGHICEICGVIKRDEDSLRDHNDEKHYKKYTCYYCGRLYKYEQSFDRHIKKHEAHLRATNKSNKDLVSDEQEMAVKKASINKQKCMCSLCGRCFVDERALMWHQRLHNNERPFRCDVCDRAFVSANRRNQHALCAHTAPTRRCPLCPALFHLRSMVNTHIKKVHLKSHKRRNRTSKHQNVFWKTEPVPIQDLSIDIQNDIIALQAAKEHEILNSTQVAEMEDL